MIKIRNVDAKNFLTKTQLGHDFVCNPYVGCEHGCLYCYAATMPGSQARNEPWGTYVDVRQYPNHNIPKNTGYKSLMFSSMTDAYQPLEGTAQNTRKILESIYESHLSVSILTKSDLVLRDLDLFKQMQSVEIGFSLALSDQDAFIFEPQATLPSKRIEALKTLHAEGLKTFVFISPIIPGITDVFAILDAIDGYADYVMFDKLNLKDLPNRMRMFKIIELKYPNLLSLYQQIFVAKESNYYHELRDEINIYLNKHSIPCRLIY